MKAIKITLYLGWSWTPQAPARAPWRCHGCWHCGSCGNRVKYKNHNIICISTIDWDFIWQGHQEIMSTLARQGDRVLFIENTGVRSVTLKDLPRLKHRLSNWRKGCGRCALAILRGSRPSRTQRVRRRHFWRKNWNHSTSTVWNGNSNASARPVGKSSCFGRMLQVQIHLGRGRFALIACFFEPTPGTPPL